MITFTVPLPPRALMPNQNMHWRIKAEPTKAYRAECRQLAEGLFETPPTRLRMSLAFCIKGARGDCPHPRRKPAEGKALRPCRKCPYAPHDESNALAAFKAGQDGIFDALGMRDSRKHLTIGGVAIDSTRGPFVEVALEVMA